jgi:rRNA maturation protein Nop10
MEAVLHAAPPHPQHIETDPQRLRELNVGHYEHGYEDEVPLKRGAPVQIIGISWQHDRLNRKEKQRWVRHDFTQSMQHTAYGEIKAPQEVDTLRDEQCPVCGESSNAYDGDTCAVCGFVAPPSQFQDPDVDRHKQLDLRGKDELAQGQDGQIQQSLTDTDRDGLDDQTGLPVDAQTAAEEGALDQQPLLGCNVCGEQFEAAHPQSVDTADPQNAEGLDGPAEGDLCPACGQGALESGTELAQQGIDPQADPNAIPDEDPDPDANPDDDFDEDGVPDEQDPDPTDPTVPGGGEEPDDSDPDDEDDEKPAGKGRPPFKR